MDFIDDCDIYISTNHEDWTLIGEALSFNVANQYGEEDLTDTAGRFLNISIIDTQHADNGYVCWDVLWSVSGFVDEEKDWVLFDSVYDFCCEDDPDNPASDYIDGDLTAGDLWVGPTNHNHWIILNLSDYYYIDIFHQSMPYSGSSYNQLSVNIYASNVSSPDDWGEPIQFHEDMTYAYAHNDYNMSVQFQLIAHYLNVSFPDPVDGSDVLRVYDAWFFGKVYVPPSAITCDSVEILNPLSIDDEVYVFAEEKFYVFNCTFSNNAGEGWSDLTDLRMKFSDGLNTVEVRYLMSQDNFTLLQGQDASENYVVRLAGGLVYNLSSITGCVHFEIFFSTWILDCLDVDVYLWGNNTDGDETDWQLTAEDYFIIYDEGGLVEYYLNNDGSKVDRGEIFEFKIDDSVGEASANWTWRDLTHLKMLPTIEIPDDRIDSLYSGEWSLYYGMYYAVDGTWIDGWYCKIEHSQGYTSLKDFWIQIHVRWYRNGLQKGSSEYFYSFYNPDPEYSTTLHVDLWFDKGNFSSLGGGRVSCEYFGMQDATAWWQFWYSDWGPLLSNGTSSEYLMDLVDGEDELIYSQQIEMVKTWCKLEKTSSTGTYVVAVRDYGIMDKVFNPYGKPFAGVDKPDLISPKVMDMPQGGFFGWVLQALKNLLVAMSPPILSFWNTFVGFVDSIFARFGFPFFFSSFLNTIRQFLSYIPTAFSFFARFLVQVFIVVTGVFTTVFDYFIDFCLIIPNFYSYCVTLLAEAEPYLGWIPETVPSLMPVFFVFFFLWLIGPLITKGNIKGTVENFEMTIGLLIRITKFLWSVGVDAFHLFASLVELIPIGE